MDLTHEYHIHESDFLVCGFMKSVLFKLQSSPYLQQTSKLKYVIRIREVCLVTRQEIMDKRKTFLMKDIHLIVWAVVYDATAAAGEKFVFFRGKC